MKVKRCKKANKRMSFYVNNFAFREPYQVMIDGTFCHAALKVFAFYIHPTALVGSIIHHKILFLFQNKVNFEEQLQKYLQSEILMSTTACVIIESEALGPKLQSVTQLLKKFRVHKCGHEKEPIQGSKCLKYMSRQSNYVIATQDRALQESIRQIAGVPLLYLHQVAPTLEQPSDASKKFVEKKTKKTLSLSTLEEDKLKYFKKKEGLAVEDKTNSLMKKKKLKGPNPLSCLKSKKSSKNKSKSSTSTQKSEGVKEKIIAKKPRVRVKIPKHVREHLKSVK